MMPGFIWTLPARVLSWHDGDTCLADVGLPRGEDVPDWHIRVVRLRCPELADPGGPEALAHAELLCPSDTIVIVRCVPLGRSGRWSSSTQESLGRLLGDIYLLDGTNFANRMVVDGFGSHTKAPGFGRSFRSELSYDRLA